MMRFDFFGFLQQQTSGQFPWNLTTSNFRRMPEASASHGQRKMALPRPREHKQLPPSYQHQQGKGQLLAAQQPIASV